MLRRQTTTSICKITGIALLFLLSRQGFSQSATVCTTAVNYSNFGVDGDLYANTPVSANGDDWFLSSQFSGSNIGVIGTTIATAQPPLLLSATDFRDLIKNATSVAGRNRTYMQRMSVPTGSVVNGQLLFDAVAYRDNIATAGTLDSTMFRGYGNKNGYNPTLWSIDVGNVPPKNDLIDVGGHIRQDLTSGHLLGYAYATTLSTTGDSHIDFEYYQTFPVFDIPTRTVSNTGPDSTGGHTAEQFTTIGTVSKTGDILISIDYSAGGTNPQSTIRIWINPTNVDGAGHDTAYINSKVSRPFTFTGVFNGGTGTHGYGYAEIKPNPSANCLISSVINRQQTLGTPWGNLTGPQAAYNDNLQALQLQEVYIDFTALGIGIIISNTTLCSVNFGSLLIKTRTSHSFTSDLKDYAGPFGFQIQ